MRSLKVLTTIIGWESTFKAFPAVLQKGMSIDVASSG